MFRNTDFDGSLSNWDVAGVTDMSFMFDGCQDLTGANTDFASWNTGAVTTMLGMFRNADSFNGTGITNWDVLAVVSFRNVSTFTEDPATELE